MKERHPRALAALAFLVLVLSAEVVGRWLVAELTLVRRVPERAHDGFDLYPLVVVATKLGIALLLARVAWRLARAHRLARARERALVRLGHVPVGRRPRLTVGLSPRMWLASFVATSLLYAVPTSTDEVTGGCWPLLAPWLHTSALPVLAVLAVVVALVWRSVARWLYALERYASEPLGRAWAPLPDLVRLPRLALRITAPRALYGVSFQSRPPPLPA